MKSSSTLKAMKNLKFVCTKLFKNVFVHTFVKSSICQNGFIGENWTILFKKLAKKNVFGNDCCKKLKKLWLHQKSIPQPWQTNVSSFP